MSEQKCDRTVCKNTFLHGWFNKSTRRYYCSDCAERINKYNPGLCIPTPIGNYLARTADTEEKKQ